MAAEDLWFGNTEKFQLVTAPTNIKAGRLSYVEDLAFENGGGTLARSSAFQQTFELNYPWGEASGTGSLEVFSEYAAGEFGEGFLYFANPMAFDLNLFPPHWASPRLVELGWPNISTGTPSWAATAANSYSQPARKGTWTITTAANATPLTDATIPYVIIPVHPSYTLQIGVTGAATGTGVVKIESWVDGASSAGASASLTLLSETGSTRMNATVAGSTYAYAKVFLTRTSSAASTVTPISMMARLTTGSPTLTGSHVRGKGHTGLMFSDSAAAEDWFDASDGVHYKALSASLTEVQAWQ